MASSPTSQKPGAEAASETPSAPPPSGGFKAWLPLILNILLMPVLAYGTVHFLILPKLQVNAKSGSAATAPSEPGQESTHEKVTVALANKIIVNVAGTMGTRYLLANLTLVGHNPAMKEAIEKNDAELRDAAAGALSVKTINDLEKPGARNLIRTELISVFNHILGEGFVSDIYLTEFAIQ